MPHLSAVPCEQGRTSRRYQGELVIGEIMLDPISDMLTRIRNAGLAKHASTRIPHSRLKERIGEILKEEGYISDVEVAGDSVDRHIVVHLKYDDRQQLAIRNIKRISRSGCRVYTAAKDIPRINQGLGMAILSTSRGVLADREARRLHVGGEILCEVW